MARLSRFCPAGMPQHIIQRGNNRQICFRSKDDFAAYAHWLSEYSTKFEVAIHAWVFMTNHVHLLATPTDSEGLSRMMQSLGRQYVRYFNSAYQRSGTLWEGRFKSCLVQSEVYLLQCYRYIELNPVRANMVASPSDYHWSSYHINAMGVESNLCTPHSEYLCLGKNKEQRRACYRELFSTLLGASVVKDLQDNTNMGLAFGSDCFKSEVEANWGRRMKPSRVGRKPVGGMLL